MSLAGRKIVVVVSGGIAAYKAADLVSRLVKAGGEVRVAMTEAARRFVAPLTFESLCGHPVYEDMFARPTAWEMDHISWARWADAIVIAPATADLLARMAAGLADDAATTLLLAFPGPVWVAPAMNSAMLGHPATEANLDLLRRRGVRFVEPGAGRLACGEVGPGRMAEPEAILDALEEGLSKGAGALDKLAGGGAPRGALWGRRVLVTAGPTREMLDPIRFLSNRSSGRMGAALAAEARDRGAEVLLIHGPMSVQLPAGVEAVAVTSARQMLEAVQRAWPGVDAAVFAAAVANYESAAPAGQKLKSGATLTLELRRTPDVAGWAGEHRRPEQTLVGFAAESENLLEAAEAKLRGKKLDLICANAIGEEGVGFDAARNQVTMLDARGGRTESPLSDKETLAGWIWDRILEFRADENGSSPGGAD